MKRQMKCLFSEEYKLLADVSQNWNYTQQRRGSPGGSRGVWKRTSDISGNWAPLDLLFINREGMVGDEVVRGIFLNAETMKLLSFGSW